MIKPKKTRVRLSPEKREQEILQYCAKIVAQEGVFAVSIEHIGKALNISKSTVYSYFPSISELLQELFRREMKSLRAAQQKAIQEANTIEQLVRGVTHAYLEYIDEKGLLISRLQADPSLSSVGGPTQYGREIAVNHLAEILKDMFGIPMSIAIPAVDISFGLPEAAGQCLNRKVTDKKTIEDLTVSMILSCIQVMKDGYDLNLRRLPERSPTKNIKG
ncbi:TetR/AcrR family transcriptional regulator [Paraglaciecola sp. 20A4]|uniref:TetR/AcrR family transcriptional regulator n=1 Tax=Paraglaciecola sp. 20A4 TaxID=2687288 RepID=UPI00140E787F|nr:TetR/AcrR family transcriptional regulator [Paraglaciecola sp. 20A4]